MNKRERSILNLWDAAVQAWWRRERCDGNDVLYPFYQHDAARFIGPLRDLGMWSPDEVACGR